MKRSFSRRILALCIGIFIGCTSLQGRVFAKEQGKDLSVESGEANASAASQKITVNNPEALPADAKQADDPAKWVQHEQLASGYVVKEDMSAYFRTRELGVLIEVEQIPAPGDQIIEKQYVYANGNPIVIKEEGGKSYIFDETGNTKLSETALESTGIIYGGGKDTDTSGDTSITIKSGEAGTVFGGGRNGTVHGNVTIVLQSGATADYINGGSQVGRVTGKVTILSNWATVKSTITGGGSGGTDENADNSVGSVDMQLTSTTVRRIDGGGFGYGASVLGEVKIRMERCTGIENFAGGSYTANTSVGSVDILIKDSDFNKWAINAYGGGIEGEVEGDVNFVLDTVIGPTIYGGSYLGAVKGNTNVTVKGNSTISGVYGGNYYGNMPITVQGQSVDYFGYVGGDMKVTIADTSTIRPYGICGGSADGEVKGSSHVYINGGTIEGPVFGGGSANTARVAGDSEVMITDGRITQSVLGGGVDAPTGGKTSVTMQGGTIEYNVWGGGQNAGAISENSGVYLYGGTIQYPLEEADRGRVICGGGFYANVTDSCEVVLDGCDVYGWLFGGCYDSSTECVNTDVKLLSGMVNKHAYGGGGGGYVSGTARITLDGATVNGWFYGGGEDGDCKASSLTYKSGRAEHNLYGGGMNGNSETALVTILGDTDIGGWIYGGAENGSVTDTARVELKGGVINTITVGGSFGDAVENAEVLLDGANATGTIFGGGYQESTTTASTKVILRSGKAIYVYSGGQSGVVVDAAILADGNAEVTNIYAGAQVKGTQHTAIQVNSGKIDTIHAGVQSDAADTEILIKGGTVRQVIPGITSGNKTVMVDGGSIKNIDSSFLPVYDSAHTELEQVMKDMTASNANKEMRMEFHGKQWFSFTDTDGKLYPWLPKGTVADDVGVIIAVPIVKDLLFTDPGNRGGNIVVTVDGIVLEKANTITVNCDNGVAGGNAVLENGKYTVTLAIPPNDTVTDVIYTLSVLVDGTPQTVAHTTITVPALVQSGAPGFRNGLPASVGKEITASKGTLAVTNSLTYAWYRSADQTFDGADIQVMDGASYTPVTEDIGSYLILVARVPGLLDAYTATADPVMSKLISFFDATVRWNSPLSPRPGNVIAVPEDEIVYLQIDETGEELTPEWKVFLNGKEVVFGTTLAEADKTYAYQVSFTAPQGCVFDPVTFSADNRIKVSKNGKTLTFYFDVKALGVTDKPEGLKGIAPQKAGGQDGKITGTNTDMEYRLWTETSYTPCTGKEITGLASGTYYIRFQEKPGFIASEDAVITVRSKLNTPMGLAWQGRTAIWNPVANAQYYLLSLYKDDETSAMKTVIISASDGFGHLFETTCDFEPEITEKGHYSFTVMAMTGISMDYESGNSSPRSIELYYKGKEDEDTSLVITARAGDGGSITPKGNIAVNYYASKTFQITPDSGYSIKDVFVNGKSVGALEEYTFEKVEKSATISAMFEKKSSLSGGGGGGKGETTQPDPEEPGADEKEEDSSKPEPDSNQTNSEGYDFADIQNHWGREAILSLLERGIFSGVSESAFAPEQAVTRGMFVTLLGRIEEIPMEATETSFRDVAKDSYYAAYIKWAYDSGIVAGMGNHQFAPDTEITREQMAQILYAYLQYKGIATEQTASLEMFSDADQIPAWAKQAVAFCYDAGLLSGKGNGLFAPKDSATRAEAASILARMLEKYHF